MSIDLFNFTASQAEYAAAQLEKLWRERRFFLHGGTDRSKDYFRNPAVFGRLNSLEQEHRQAYRNAREVAEGYLRDVELKLHVAGPELDGRNLVQCNRYGGGLAICTAWPLVQFAKYVPNSLNDLLSEIAMRFDNGTPSLTRFTVLAEAIWKEFELLDQRSSDDRAIVVLKTQFVPDCGSGDDDLFGGRVIDLQKYSHALGYLLYQASLELHLLPGASDPQILTSTIAGNHVSLHHPSLYNKPQAIYFSASHKYVKKVHFATVT